MNIIFSDNNKASVRLIHIGKCENILFKIMVSSECFDFESRTSFSERALLEFRESIISMNKLKCLHIVLFSNDDNFRIDITCNKCGHLSCVLKVKSVYGAIDAVLKIEEDLSYLPEVINQIDVVMNQLNRSSDSTDKEEDNINSGIANVSLKVTDSHINNNKQLIIGLSSPFYNIFRDVEITKEEERDLFAQLDKFINYKENVSFFPLGEFTNFVLCWDNEKAKIRISGSISDYQYPYNSINFNVLGRVRIIGTNESQVFDS